MKVLATNGRESCIVEMTKDEIANLAGFYSSYSMDSKGPKMEPGCSVEISKLYKDATFLVEMYAEQTKEINSAWSRIARLAELLKPKTEAAKKQ